METPLERATLHTKPKRGYALTVPTVQFDRVSENLGRSSTREVTMQGKLLDSVPVGPRIVAQDRSNSFVLETPLGRDNPSHEPKDGGGVVNREWPSALPSLLLFFLITLEPRVE